MRTARVAFVLAASVASCDGLSDSPTAIVQRPFLEASNWVGTARLISAEPQGDCLVDAIRAAEEPIVSELATHIELYLNDDVDLTFWRSDDEEEFVVASRRFRGTRTTVDQISAAYDAGGPGVESLASPALPEGCPVGRVRRSTLDGRFSSDGRSFVGVMRDRIPFRPSSTEVLLELEVRLERFDG